MRRQSVDACGPPRGLGGPTYSIRDAKRTVIADTKRASRNYAAGQQGEMDSGQPLEASRNALEAYCEEEAFAFAFATLAALIRVLRNEAASLRQSPIDWMCAGS